ncbi:Hypothetical protein NTJ_12246 [Nesidiocoris tenuis]|uniref:Uncharacterized protein n=1 Tax=Nesidiocoris tenuis TaxID=355587 RepID=A0ABN7B4V4_9HEMI|nr:Hypothetical protein NTJ_12246 [Nesidiocoris tenuis]
MLGGNVRKRNFLAEIRLNNTVTLFRKESPAGRMRRKAKVEENLSSLPHVFRCHKSKVNQPRFGQHESFPRRNSGREIFRIARGSRAFRKINRDLTSQLVRK